MPLKKKRQRTNDRVTLDDIARYCNVSKATVSRVLNDKLNQFPVSEKMIEKVRKAAQQLGYRPNRLAKAVRTQRTNLIGLSLLHQHNKNSSPTQIAHDNQIMGLLANTILAHPDFKDYDLVIHKRSQQNRTPLHESDFKSDLLDGMIYMTPSDDHTEFLDISSPEFPIILLGHTADAEKKLPCVDIDNRKAAFAAVEHLIQSGRKNILYLNPEQLEHICCMVERLDGYKDALKQYGLPISNELIHNVDREAQKVNEFFQNLRCLNQIDAIFATTDNLAALCLQSLQAMGKRIPKDIAIIGFNNTPLTELTSPTLSSVQWPIEAQASTAIDLLLKILNKQIPYQPGFTEIKTQIIRRQSTSEA